MASEEHRESEVARAVKIIEEDDIEYDKTPLGQGGFGIVWKGTWTCKVAVKKYTISASEIPQEVLALASVRSHENITTLYGVVRHRFTIGIVMELAPDGSLHDYLHKKSQKPSLEQSVDWAAQVARGMKHLHDNNIIHRDLKSQNVLLSGKVAKICDFGTARVLERTRTKQSGIAGTYPWMAPEVMREEEAIISRRCDTYSYAMVMYEMFEHKVPFHEIKTKPVEVEIANAVLKNGQRPTITVSLPPYISSLIKICWREDPEKRPAFDQVLQVLETRSVSEWLNQSEVVKIDRSDLVIGGMLGRGGSGSVYKGMWKQRGGMTVAIKVSQTNDPEELPQEVKIWGSLPPHRNIITLIGVASVDFTIYIVTELAVNRSLFHYLHMEKKTPSVDQSLAWALDVACGMKHLHNHDIIHRDLKSAHVLLTSEWVVKLCDFGCARELTHTITTDQTGTYRWMAPEIMRQASARINKKCDLFSYGMVLFELFAHKIPYSDLGDNLDVLMNMTKGERPPIPPTLPPYLHDLLRSCWKEDPHQRPTFDDFVNKIVPTKTE